MNDSIRIAIALGAVAALIAFAVSLLGMLLGLIPAMLSVVQPEIDA